MKSYRAFTILLVASVTLASTALEAARFGFVEPRLIAGLALIYAIAMRLRDSLYRSETTFFDADHGRGNLKEELIVFGHGIEDRAHESKERRLLMDLVDFGGQRYKIYLVWIVSTVLAILLQTRFRALTFVDVIVPLLILSSFSFSPFLSQLLLPLAVSLIVALCAIVKSDAMIVLFYFVLFAVAFFLSLYLYREITPDRLNADRVTPLPLILKTACLITILFLGLYGIFDYLIPEENPFKRGSVASAQKPRRLSTDNVSREIAEQILKFQERRPEASPENSDVHGDEKTSANTAESLDRTADKPYSDERSFEGESSEPRMAKSNGRGGTKNLSKNSNHSEQSQRRQHSDQQHPSNQFPQNPSSYEQDFSDRADGNRGEPEQSPSGGQGDGTGHAARKESGQEGGRTDGQAVARGEQDGTRVNEKGQTQTDAKREGRIHRANENSVKRQQKLEEIKRKVELPVQIGKAVVFMIVAGAALLMIFNFFSKRKNEEEDVIKTQQLSPRQRLKLQSILHQIRSRGLSADAEVIETYNALLSVFEMGRHPREEWLPAEDFSKKIAETIPTLSKSFESVTNRFSRTLYGRKSVLPEELKVFRTEVGQILRFFQVG